MNPKLRRFLPLLLALLCWSAVALVPGTRSGLQTAWSGRFVDPNFQTGDEDDIETRPVDNEVELRQKFADSPYVQIDEITRSTTPLQETGPPQWRRNPFILSWRLHRALALLKQERNEGPLSNTNYPKAPPAKTPNGTSPRAEWDKFIALARRGQQLEPNNTFFDWMLLYGLYATRQDEAARHVLLQASRKTNYDSHLREANLNRLQLSHLFYGAVLSPRDQTRGYSEITAHNRPGQVARWVMEGVIADRQKKQHARALNCAFALLKMGRVMRLQSYDYIGSLVAQLCEAVAVSYIDLPLKMGGTKKPRLGAGLGSFQRHPHMLYAYAKSQNRTDITRFLNSEWVELGHWQGAKWSKYLDDWMGNTSTQRVCLLAAERLAAIILWAMPSLVIGLILFFGLSRRFRDDTNTTLHGFWLGALWGMALLVLMMIFDASIVLRRYEALHWEAEVWEYIYMNPDALLSTAPAWVTWGLAGTLFCIAFHGAVLWQKTQAGKAKTLWRQFKTLFEAPEDGVALFDFGPLMSFVVRLTLWLLLLGALLVFCLVQKNIRDATVIYYNFCAAWVVGSLIAVSLVLHLAALRSLPHRRQTIRLTFRLAFEAFYGFFVAASVLYALVAFVAFVAFVALPFAFQYQRNFEKAIQRGELNTLRATVGL